MPNRIAALRALDLVTLGRCWRYYVPTRLQRTTMAISEFETKKCEKELEAFMRARRPPAHSRSELDLGYRISNQSVEIFEIRPQWRDPSQKMEHPVAKATYVKTQKCWKIFWQQADLKWHGYEPAPTAKTLNEFLSIVNEDKYACFFG